MTDTKYNGWTNHETWNVSLWIGNEQGSYEYWRETAQECYDEMRGELSAYAKFTGKEIFTHDERATQLLERRLKNEFEESAPELGASMWADLLGAALSEVNWHEIAEHMINEVDRSDDDTSEDDETDGE